MVKRGGERREKGEKEEGEGGMEEGCVCVREREREGGREEEYGC